MKHTEEIRVVKIGGNVIDNPETLERFVRHFAQLPDPKILIHGGGKLATRLAEKLEIPTRMVDGRRITDEATLEVVTMVYAGAVNKQLVAKLQEAGCNAMGLCGADGNLIPATRRSPFPVDYGFVGDIVPIRINTDLLHLLLKAGYTPVFSAITHDGQGSLLNSNADSVAQSVAVAASTLAPTDLHFCFEKTGVLRDVDDPDSLIEEITPKRYAELRASGVISQGMLPKIENALKAVAAGVRRVVIQHADNLCNGVGTFIQLDSHV